MLANIDYWRDAPVWTVASIERATADWFRLLDPQTTKRSEEVAHG
jgi:UDP-glucose 4-epimerase